MENIEKTLDIIKCLNSSKHDIRNIKNSLVMDKYVLTNESAEGCEAYYKYGFLTSLDSISKLGFSLEDTLTIESAVVKKLSIIDKIKEMFKQKKVLVENKSVRITDKDIPENINNGEITKEIFYGEYDFITTFVNNNKIDNNDLIANFESYYRKVDTYYNKFLKDSKLFDIEHLVSFNNGFIGHKFTDKLDILNNKNLFDVFAFDLDKIKIKDKQNKLNVIEYRYLFLNFEVKPILYIIKYIKAGDVTVVDISYNRGYFKNKLNTVKLDLTKDDIIKIMLEKKYDDIWLPLPDNSYVYEGSSKIDLFFKEIDKILNANKNVDVAEIKKIPSTSFDYWDEYDTDTEYNITTHKEIKKHLFNICYDNFYDNIEQMHNGNILNYNYYWNIAANIIDLFKKGKLGK